MEIKSELKNREKEIKMATFSRNHSSLSDYKLKQLNMKRCPLNKSHVIKVSKYQRHVFECLAKLNPSEADKWIVCPLNATHIIPKEELDKHLLTCDESKRILREHFQHMSNKEYSSANKLCPINDIKIKEEKLDQNIKEEVIESKEPSVRPKTLQNKIKNDEWNDTNVEDFSIYKKSDSKEEEEIINESLPEDNGFIDMMSYSKLERPFRKKLLERMTQNLKNESESRGIHGGRHLNPMFDHPFNRSEPKINTNYHFYALPPTKVVKEDRNSSVLELNTNFKVYSQNPLTKDMISSQKLLKDLHSVNVSANYKKLIVSDGKRENMDSIVSKALRSIDLSNDCKTFQCFEVIDDQTIRKPKTNPFPNILRKPN